MNSLEMEANMNTVDVPTALCGKGEPELATVKPALQTMPSGVRATADNRGIPATVGLFHA